MACEVFGVDRRDDGLPAYDFAVVAGQPGPLRPEGGFTLATPFGLERLVPADLIVVAAVSNARGHGGGHRRLPAPGPPGAGQPRRKRKLLEETDETADDVAARLPRPLDGRRPRT